LTTFADPDDINHPEFKNTRASYWATLCEAHLAVVNELIQRYRMATYDPFAYEVSARDVPIWNLKHATLSSSPGEFDLLDARSLMERGDFTGAAALMFRFAIRSDKEGITVVSR